MKAALFALLWLTACGGDDDGGDAAVDARDDRDVGRGDARDDARDSMPDAMPDARRDADAAPIDATPDADAAPDADATDDADAMRPATCDDYMPVEGMACTISGDCPPSLPFCAPQGPGEICAARTCGVCGDSEGCFEGIPGGCGTTVICVPRCNGDTPCAEGSRCVSDDDSGAMACEPIPCGEDGYVCPENYDCIREPGTFDNGDALYGDHFCIRRRCAFDDECDCGVCVDGQCRSGPGVCNMLGPG